MALPPAGALGTNFGATTNAPSIGAPSGVVAKSIVVCYFFLDSGPQTITGSGWAEAPNSPVNVTGGSHGLHVMWHRASGSESGPYSFSWTTSTYCDAFTQRYDSCVLSGTPFDSPCGAAESNASSTTSPAVSTSSLDVDRLDIWASTNWSGGAWTAPGGYTKQRESTVQILTCATHDHPVAGSTGSITGSCAGNDKRTAWIGALIGTTVGGASGPIPALSQYNSFH